MPAEAPRPERDEKHERVLASLMRLDRSPSAFRTAETREIVGDAYQWLRTIMSDLRGHETALAQAERRAEEAERLAAERLGALDYLYRVACEYETCASGDLSAALNMAGRIRNLPSALTAAAKGTGADG